MTKEPKQSQKLRRTGVAEAFVDTCLAVGRVAFSLADLVNESGQVLNNSAELKL